MLILEIANEFQRASFPTFLLKKIQTGIYLHVLLYM